MSGNWRAWLLLCLLLLLMPFFHFLPTMRNDELHVLYPKWKREWKFDSFSAFNILRKSGAAPLLYSATHPRLKCKKGSDLSVWDYGTPSFVAYMNKVYIPLREQQFRYDTVRVVYAKYGTPGIANQMKCACDTLLFALLTNRTFQSRNSTLFII